jgi:hypothetical protein
MIFHHEKHEGHEGFNNVISDTPKKTLLSVCHSEEYSDEESAFDSCVLVERIEKSAKQMFHFVQHDTTENLDRPEEFVLLSALCPSILLRMVSLSNHVFARDNGRLCGVR